MGRGCFRSHREAAGPIRPRALLLALQNPGILPGMKTTKRIQIFRAGRQRTRAGESIEFTEADLARTAAAYDPAKSEAPIVVGHPKTDAPAFGWVKKLIAEGGGLTAEVDQLNPEFAEAVKSGTYKHVSAAFYSPTNPANPAQGSYYLRHVGFLGAQPPAVKGLAPVEFAAEGADVEAELEFSEEAENAGAAHCEEAAGKAPEPQPESEEAAKAPGAEADLSPQPTDGENIFYRGQFNRFAGLSPQPALHSGEGEPENDAQADKSAELSAREAALADREKALLAREAALQAEEAARKRADAVSFAEGLASEGRILPRDRSGVVELLLALPTAPLEFAEGQSEAPDKWLRDFLSRIPKQIEFSELSAPAAQSAESTIEARAAAIRKRVEEARKQGRSISYDEAARLTR